MTRAAASFAVLLAFAIAAYAQHSSPAHATDEPSKQAARYTGFDRNDYPGDQALPTLRRHFSFASYWLNNPPGAHTNTWTGKRDLLLRNGFGFLLLANGRLEAEIAAAAKSGTTASALATSDAANTIAAAGREHFPAGAILFLDQEEGGRLTSKQADYLFAWTEAVAHSRYRAGAYVSGQSVGDGPGRTITTAQDIREHVAAQHLHPIALWVYQDACPPANGCTLVPPPLELSGTPGVLVWQYAQSPRRADITSACSKTYASDGNCYAPDLPGVFLDLNVSRSADPSHGR
ncbi:MAG: DUF1906 domain-containing protein [Acidobacteriota bacterium]|nr:DUF1906 domain-containing protein [Acidobacteriota bacterium]